MNGKMLSKYINVFKILYTDIKANYFYYKKIPPFSYIVQVMKISFILLNNLDTNTKSQNLNKNTDTNISILK